MPKSRSVNAPRQHALNPALPIVSQPRQTLPQSHADFRHGLGHHVRNLGRQDEDQATRRRYDLPEMLATGATRMAQNIEQTLIRDVQAQLASRAQYLLHQQDVRQQAVMPGLLALSPQVMDDCCAPSPLTEQNPSLSKPSNSVDSAGTWQERKGHDHEHLLMIDLDEAVHGLYASSGYIAAAANDPAQVRQQLMDEATQLAHQPWHYLKHDLATGGVPDMGMAIGITLPMFYFAYLAMHGGHHEIQHARQWLAQLNTLRQSNQTHQQALRTIMSSVNNGTNDVAHNDHQLHATTASRGPLASRLSALRADAARLFSAHSVARLDLGIGLASFASGFAIALKASADLGLKIALGIQSSLSAKSFFTVHETVQVSAAAGSAATSVAFAGTVVLAPLAGLFATILGGLMTRKSSQQLRQVKQTLRHYRLAMPSIMARLAANQSKPWLEKCLPYGEFMERQLGKRRSFYRRFLRWNKAFMIGSGIYAASATVKAVLVVLAIVGVAALASNPIGLGVLLGVGLTGALIMAAGSLAFFHGHAKQGRYSQDWFKDHAAVDRRFLSVLDRFSADEVRLSDSSSSSDDESERLSSGASTSRGAATKASSSTDAGLFADAGLVGGTGLRRLASTPSITSLAGAMGVSGMDLRVRCLAWLDERRGRFDEAGQPVSGLAKLWQSASAALGEPAQPQPLYTPRDRRANVWQRWRGNCLSSRRLDAWLRTEPGLQAAKAFLLQDVTARMAFLQHKLETRLQIDKACLDDLKPSEAQGGKETTSLLALQDLALQWDADVEVDQANLERCRALWQLLDKPDVTWKQLEPPLADYLGIAVPKAKQKHALGWVFLRGIYQDCKKARGVLACSIADSFPAS